MRSASTTDDPTDLGLPGRWGDPSAYGRRRLPNGYERAAYLEQAATRHGWTGDVASRAERRRVMAHPCPRSTCLAPATVACRSPLRGGQRRTITELHDERRAAAAAGDHSGSPAEHATRR